METWKCKWCHTEKALLNKYTKSGHLARCQKWIEFKTLTLTKQTLETWYLVERLTSQGWVVGRDEGHKVHLFKETQRGRKTMEYYRPKKKK
jgi:hypothetical protein